MQQKCSGLTNASFHQDLWLCLRCQTPSLSPPKGKSPSPLLPSSILIPPLMGNNVNPPRSSPLTGKGAVPLSLLSPPLLMGRPRPHFTPQPPLIKRLTPLILILTSPSSPSTPSSSSFLSFLSFSSCSYSSSTSESNLSHPSYGSS